MLEREPLLNQSGFTGGIIYYDCMTDDARMTLENAMAASQNGVLVITQAKVVKLDDISSDDLAQVTFRDLIGERDVAVKAKVVVNCTGVWTDSVRQFAEIEGSIIHPKKSMH